MVRNIIITCGTSLINSETLKGDNFLVGKIDTLSSDKDEHVEDFLDNLTRNDYRSFENTRYITHYGAELNLLKKIGYCQGDKIFMFFSDTDGGKVMKSFFEGYFQTDYAKKLLELSEGEIKVGFHTISGFSNDANKFHNEAINDFFTKLEEIKQITGGDEVIMCPVGGYKSMIPYASLFAMIYGRDIKYLYEGEDEILTLPRGAISGLSVYSYLSDQKFLGITEVAPVLSSNYDFHTALDIIVGVKEFVDHGKSVLLSKTLEKIQRTLEVKIQEGKKGYIKEKEVVSNLKNRLLKLSLSMDLIRTSYIKSHIKNIQSLKEDIEANITDVFLKHALLFLIEEISKMSSLVTWYFDKSRYAEVILLIREGTIDYVMRELGLQRESKNREIRTKVENSIWTLTKDKTLDSSKYLGDEKEKKIKELFIGKKMLWEQITEVRNSFAHINIEQSTESMEEKIKDLYKQSLFMFDQD